VRLRRWLGALLAAGLSLGAALPAGEAVLAKEPPELVQELEERGLVVLEDVASRERTTFVIAYVRFAQPRARVVALVTDPARQLEWRTDIESVEVVERTEWTRLDEVTMRLIFRDFVYRVRYVRDPETERIAWSLDPSFDNSFARLDGFWEFYALAEGGTLGRFGTRVDAGAAIPAFMQRDLTRRNVVKTMEKCRKWVDSDGEWRP
jgi:catechol 2,3-dioxygenase-like lactoylglutathione lyase family enzyme